MQIFTPEFLTAVKRLSPIANKGDESARNLIRTFADDFSSAMGVLFDCLAEPGKWEKNNLFSSGQFDCALFDFRLSVVTLSFMQEAIPAWRAMQSAKEAAQDGEAFPNASEDDIEDALSCIAPAFAFSFAYGEKNAVKRLFNEIIIGFYSWNRRDVDFEKEAPAAYAAMRKAFFAAYGKKA